MSASVADDGGERLVRYDIEIENRAPRDGLPRYTVGPWRTVGLDAPGTYYGQLAVLVPAYASSAQFDGAVPLAASGLDGVLFINATSSFTVAPGTTQRYSFEFSLPREAPSLQLIPSARFPFVPWSWSGRDLTDRVFVDLE